MGRLLPSALGVLMLGLVFVPGSMAPQEPAPPQQAQPMKALPLPQTSGTQFKLSRPQEVPYQPGKLCRVSAEGTDGKVTWDYEVNPASDIDWLVDAKSLAFPIPAPGTVVRIVAATVKGDEALIAKTTVTVTGTSPVVPNPFANGTKANAPPATGRIASAAIVYKGSEGAPGTPVGKLIANKNLKTALATRSINLREPVDVASTDPAVRSLKYDRQYAQTKKAFMVFHDEADTLIPNGIWTIDALTGDPDADVRNLLNLVDQVNKLSGRGDK
jgi:hypothetical protein